MGHQANRTYERRPGRTLHGPSGAPFRRRRPVGTAVRTRRHGSRHPPPGQSAPVVRGRHARRDGLRECSGCLQMPSGRRPGALGRPSAGPRSDRERAGSAPGSPCPNPPRRHGCSNTGRRVPLLHRSGRNLPSTAWGLGSCPYCVHRGICRYSIRPGQVPGDLWSTMIHSLWTKFSSTGGLRGCPPSAHRPGRVVPSFSTALSTVRQPSARFHRRE